MYIFLQQHRQSFYQKNNVVCNHRSNQDLEMPNLTIKSAFIAMGMALNAAAVPQCATHADSLPGHMYESNNHTGLGNTENEEVHVTTSTRAVELGVVIMAA
ncbi:uncharacterized protein MAM_04583 [Metarhizium album ARSEF 1941]|uniref:Uncharacterized protein n=1 Tax=Metarhizium album (strain ARSEF 1941) TaxID=1081103 RepID=A0A0B2WU28_METAS|nr:uncharacterized protein MAM_04583 [Metarhizium album ARSEF 1941]KHN97568.1 hypothetical protein MAM_04583 [Metarhizium album ARSEF 1941]